VESHLVITLLGERRRSVEVHGLLSGSRRLDVRVVKVRIRGFIGNITLIVPFDLEEGAVIVVVHANLLVEHLIRPEPETAKVLIILKSLKLRLDGLEPISNLSRDMERSAVSILLQSGVVDAEHANLGKILLNTVLEVDKEVTVLRILITDSIIKTDELSGLKRNAEEVIHELIIETSISDVVFLISTLNRGNGVLPELHVRASLLLNARNPVLRVKRTRANKLLIPRTDILHPISHGVRATATTTIGVGAVGQIVPAVTDDETTSLTLLGGELIVVTNNIHSMATLAESLTVHEELTVHVEHRRKNASAELRTIETIGGALHSETSGALDATLPVGVVAREEVDSVVHLRRPCKRTVLFDHQALSLDDVVSSGHRLNVELDGVLSQSLLHVRAVVLMIRVSVRADGRRKNLGVHLLKVVKPPDFTTLSAVMENEITNDITNVGVVLASLDHGDTISLFIETDVLILLEEALLDTVLTVALLKNTNGSEVPAGATVLLIVARSLVLSCIAIRKITLVPGHMSCLLSDATNAGSTLSTGETMEITMEITTGFAHVTHLILLLKTHAGTTGIISQRHAGDEHASDNSRRNDNSLHCLQTSYFLY